MRSRLAAFLSAALCILALAPSAAAGDWDAAYKTFKQEFAVFQKAAQERERALGEVAAVKETMAKATVTKDGKSAVTMPAAELERCRGVLRDSGAVVEASTSTMQAATVSMVAALRGHSTKEAVKAIAAVANVVDDESFLKGFLDALEDMHSPAAFTEMASELKSTRHTLLARSLCRALWRSGNADAQAAVLSAVDNKDANKSIAALDAVGFAESGPVFDTAIKMLDSKVWQVRIAALQLLIRSVGETNEDIVVKAAIARMGKEDGRVRADLHAFLSKRMDGASGADDPERWSQIWENFKHDRASGALEDPDSTGSTYYGIPIYSKHIVFVLDVSGSMDAPHNIVRQPSPIDPAKPKAVITDEVESGKDRQPVKKKDRTELDWSKIVKKIDLAKAELVRTLEELEEDVFFSIVTYSTGFDVLSEALVPATPANKKKFIDMIQGLSAGGSTDAFFTAQFAAMDRYVAGGPKPQPKKLAKGQNDLQITYANTLYFLTDGFPTVGGGGAGGGMPQDVKDTHLAEIERRFDTGKVVINTVGIGPHDRGLLEQIATMTGGTYVDFSR